MNKERHLLPWVLGGLSAVAVAAVVAAVSSTKTAPPTPTPLVAAPSAPVTAQAPAPAPDRTVAAATPAPEADPTPQQFAMQAQAAPESAATSGQIWQCTTKGVKTFSNNPCGDKSTLLEIGPVNTMNPTPTVHYARAYAPEPHYADSDSSADQEPYADQAGVESSGNSYAIVQGVGFVARRRPEHPHHQPMPHHRPMPNHRNSGPLPRKY